MASSPPSSALPLVAGSAVWVRCTEGSSEPFSRAVVVSPPGAPAEPYVLRAAGRMLTLAPHEVLPACEEERECADNTGLAFLSDATLLHNLRLRFDRRRVYTYTGAMLLAVNPVEQVEGLYDLAQMERYRGRPLGTEPPHVYALADRAYRLLRVERRDQSIVISGESGAGKTENSKHVLRYLATLSGRQANGGADTITERILQTTPVLEAFGNARTTRNNNSSRFGKFTRIHFCAAGQLVGADIVTYLLETSRVTLLSHGERSFHIFYQLLSGASAAQRASLYLDSLDEHLSVLSFPSLAASGCTKIVGVDDAYMFSETCAALHAIGLSTAEADQVFGVLAALMHLGRLEFLPDEASGDGVSLGGEDNGSVLEAVTALLRLDMAQVVAALTSTHSGGAANFVRALREKDALAARDALSKHVYTRLFRWLVRRCQQSVAPTGDAEYHIGILDIYGFEVFECNGFEQLCINFANEKLQQHFVQEVFHAERALYRAEAIPFPEDLVFPDNAPLCSLIEGGAAAPARPDSDTDSAAPFEIAKPRLGAKPRMSLFELLDEETMLPHGTDAALLDKIYNVHESPSDCAVADAPLLYAPKLGMKLRHKGNAHRGGAFVLSHFAGDVTYSVTRFIERNNESLSADLTRLLHGSNLPLMRDLYPGAADDEAAANDGTPHGRRRRATTVSSRFCSELNQLLRVLRASDTHFVRCIKPSAGVAERRFDGRYVWEQLRTSGMLAAVCLMASGYPSRCTFVELRAMFANIPSLSRLTAFSPLRFSKALLSAVEMPGEDFRIGMSRVFFRAGQMAFLERLRNMPGEPLPREVVSALHKRLIRQRWQSTGFFLACARAVDAAVRSVRRWHGWRRAARVLLLVGRSWIMRARRIRSFSRARVLQRHARRLLARSYFGSARAAVTRLSALARARSCAAQYCRQREAALRLETAWRRVIGCARAAERALHVSAVLVLESHARRVLATRRVRMRRHFAAVTVIACCARARAARLLLQRRRLKELRARRESASMQIQRHARARRERRLWLLRRACAKGDTALLAPLLITLRSRTDEKRAIGAPARRELFSAIACAWAAKKTATIRWLVRHGVYRLLLCDGHAQALRRALWPDADCNIVDATVPLADLRLWHSLLTEVHALQLTFALASVGDAVGLLTLLGSRASHLALATGPAGHTPVEVACERGHYLAAVACVLHGAPITRCKLSPFYSSLAQVEAIIHFGSASAGSDQHSLSSLSLAETLARAMSVQPNHRHRAAANLVMLVAADLTKADEILHSSALFTLCSQAEAPRSALVLLAFLLANRLTLDVEKYDEHRDHSVISLARSSNGSPGELMRRRTVSAIAEDARFVVQRRLVAVLKDELCNVSSSPLSPVARAGMHMVLVARGDMAHVLDLLLSGEAPLRPAAAEAIFSLAAIGKEALGNDSRAALLLLLTRPGTATALMDIASEDSEALSFILRALALLASCRGEEGAEVALLKRSQEQLHARVSTLRGEIEALEVIASREDLGEVAQQEHARATAELDRTEAKVCLMGNTHGFVLSIVGAPYLVDVIVTHGSEEVRSGATFLLVSLCANLACATLIMQAMEYHALYLHRASGHVAQRLAAVLETLSCSQPFVSAVRDVGGCAMVVVAMFSRVLSALTKYTGLGPRLDAHFSLWLADSVHASQMVRLRSQGKFVAAEEGELANLRRKRRLAERCKMRWRALSCVVRVVQGVRCSTPCPRPPPISAPLILAQAIGACKPPPLLEPAAIATIEAPLLALWCSTSTDLAQAARHAASNAHKEAGAVSLLARAANAEASGDWSVAALAYAVLHAELAGGAVPKDRLIPSATWPDGVGLQVANDIVALSRRERLALGRASAESTESLLLPHLPTWIGARGLPSREAVPSRRQHEFCALAQISPPPPLSRASSFMSVHSAMVSDNPEAEGFHRRGLEANRNGELKKARALFLEASRLSGKASHQISAANMALKLGLTALATTEYRVVLARHDLTSAHRAHVHRKLAQAEGDTAKNGQKSAEGGRGPGRGVGGGRGMLNKN